LLAVLRARLPSPPNPGERCMRFDSLGGSLGHFYGKREIRRTCAGPGRATYTR